MNAIDVLKTFRFRLKSRVMIGSDKKDPILSQFRQVSPDILSVLIVMCFFFNVHFFNAFCGGVLSGRTLNIRKATLLTY